MLEGDQKVKIKEWACSFWSVSCSCQCHPSTGPFPAATVICRLQLLPALSESASSAAGQCILHPLGRSTPQLCGAPLQAFIFYKFIVFIYFWLCWVFVALRGLSLVGASGGYSLLWCVGFSLWWLLLLQGTRCAGFSSCGSWALEHRLSSCGAQA